jgi:hypothetical protein
MKEGLPRWLPATALLLQALVVHAQTNPLPPETQLVAVSSAPAPTQETFTIASAEDLTVTLTDLASPAALASATVVVTQGATIVGQASLAQPQTSPSTPATLTLTAAVGTYTLYVTGAPGANSNVGTFSVCVASKATPSTCMTDASILGTISASSAASSTVSSVSATLTVTTPGAYTITYNDDQFPVALSTPPSLALFQGSTQIAVPVPASPATIFLNAGTYTLDAVAQADATAKAGLYGISVTGPAGVAPLLNSAYPVGSLAAASQASNPSQQTLTLKVTDFAFPTPLASAKAIVTSGAAVLGTAAAGASSSFTAPAGAVQVWSLATAGTTGAGTYEVDLTSASASLLQSAAGVSNGATLAYAYVTPVSLTPGGSYTANGSDFEFPTALQGLQFAVAQSDAILVKSSAVGSVSFTAAGTTVGVPAVVLAAASTPSASGSSSASGLFDVNIQTTGTTAQIVFDQTQGVSATGVFNAQTLTITTAGNYDVTLTDLKFPTQFASLALTVSSGGASLGKIFGGGTFTINASAGTYLLDFVATPGTPSGGTAQYGLYGLQIVASPVTVALNASPTSLTDGASTTLTWTTTNATACTASGGNFTGSQSVGSGSATVVVAQTTTFSLACTGPGGSATQTVTVTATQGPTSSKSGGGMIDISLLCLLGGLAARRLQRSGRAAAG